MGELRDYLGQLAETAEGEYRAYCANGAVDAIAAHYSALAEAQRVEIDWRLELPAALLLRNCKRISQ